MVPAINIKKHCDTLRQTLCNTVVNSGMAGMSSMGQVNRPEVVVGIFGNLINRGVLMVDNKFPDAQKIET